MANSVDSSNKIDFIKGLSFVPWEWRNLGAAFSKSGVANQSIGTQCGFTLRPGVEQVENVNYGSVVDGQGAFSVGLKSRDFAFNVSASNVFVKLGADEPVKAVAGQGPASLKVSLAKQFNEDNYVGVSYDLKLKKPELSVCWTGQTFLENSSLMVTAHPLDNCITMRAAVATPGPEWRRTLLDDMTGRLEEPRDDGGRHRFYIMNEMRQHNLTASTQVGCSLDVGRVVNSVADFVDNRLERKIPPVIWKIPGSVLLYGLLVPPEDEEQVRGGSKPCKDHAIFC